MTFKQLPTSSARRSGSWSSAHENPDGDALGSLLGATLGLRALGKDAVMYLAGERADAGRVPVPRPVARSCASCPPTSKIASCSPSTARTSAGSRKGRQAVTRARFVVDVDHHHDNSRFGDVNLVVPDASSTAEVIRDILRELDVDLTPRDRRGPLRRSRDRYRPLPVHEHDAEGAPPRGRARRGRRRRPRDLPARLRDGAVREAEAPRACARPGAAHSKAAARRLVPPARGLRRGRRRGAVLGGDHRQPAGGRRARRWSR